MGRRIQRTKQIFIRSKMLPVFARKHSRLQCTKNRHLRSRLVYFTGRATVEFCRKLLNTDPRIIAAILAKSTCTNEIINLVAETIGCNRTTDQPEAFKINPDLAPDFDAAFDDEPQSRRLIIRRRPATTGRRLPTPKSRRQVYDFSKYKDTDTLRKSLNTGDIDTVITIAESYREFQPRTDGKRMTKTDYVTAIIRLYFPNYQPVPAKKSNTPTAEEIAQVRLSLREGKYGISFFDGMARDEATAYLYHYSCWNGYYSLKELHLITKALKKIKE